MPAKPKKTSLAKLTAEWDKKLKDSGFEDIEQTQNGVRVLKRWSTIFIHDPYQEVRGAQAEYYQMATRFLNEYKFENNIEKVIWEYHSEGIGIKNIAKVLKKAKVKSIGVKKSAVWLIIQKLKKSMYAMYLAPKTEYHE